MAHQVADYCRVNVLSEHVRTEVMPEHVLSERNLTAQGDITDICADSVRGEQLAVIIGEHGIILRPFQQIPAEILTAFCDRYVPVPEYILCVPGYRLVFPIRVFRVIEVRTDTFIDRDIRYRLIQMEVFPGEGIGFCRLQSAVCHQLKGIPDAPAAVSADGVIVMVLKQGITECIEVTL